MTIVAEEVCKSFEGNEVLKGLSITVNTGETVVILGRSGVGKSVLLKHIIGIMHPDKGRVIVDDVCISGLEEHDLYSAVKNMGMLFQSSALFDSMNVSDNTAFYLHQHGDPVNGKAISKSEVRDRVAEALDMVGLDGTQKKMPSELSGGMRKRAALARLIVYRPRILLYDEPTTGLDPITAMQINELIVKTQQELKSTSIVVTHDIRSAEVVGDKLALHHDGKMAHFDHKEAFLKSDNPLIVNFLKNAAIGTSGGNS